MPDKQVYSCRFIPSRAASRFEFSSVAEALSPAASSLFLLHNGSRGGASSSSFSNSNGGGAGGAGGAGAVGGATTTVNAAASSPPARESVSKASLYTAVLKNQLLGDDDTFDASNKNVFRFQSNRFGDCDGSLDSGDTKCARFCQEKNMRKIARKPFKVLDAPALQDDFYLNVVDWSAQNVLAVGLGTQVFMWNACTSKVFRLCDYASTQDTVASVCWTNSGSHLAVGTGLGEVQIWDVTKGVILRSLKPHEGRVGALAWCGASHQRVLASGSRDRTIMVRDVRDAAGCITVMEGHKQEVCGLKWSPDDTHVASGGNDNALMLWRLGHTSAVCRFEHHTAAVKAIAWSPHQHGVLASGGGTADRCIRFWNTSTHSPMHHVDTGSQVCNIAWSRNVNELVSTHGYSQNQVIVWKFPTMAKQATLIGHTLRVLYLAVSPDGEAIVTGAGDETLRFWNVFPGSPSKYSRNEENVFLRARNSLVR